MNQSVYHLVVFVASLAALLALVITGHDNNIVLVSGLTGIIGATGANASGNLFSLPTSVLPNNVVTSPKGTTAPTVEPESKTL